MAGYTTTRKGDQLIVTIDLKSDLGISASGKSHMVASSHGNKPIKDGDGAVMGLNVFRPVEA